MAEIREIKSNEEFQEFIKESENGKTSVLKIGSSFCGPCRMLEQTIRELTPIEVEGVMLGEVNADDEWFEDKADELKIRGIPVLIAYRDGVELERLTGAVAKSALIEFFERNK